MGGQRTGTPETGGSSGGGSIAKTLLGIPNVGTRASGPAPTQTTDFSSTMRPGVNVAGETLPGATEPDIYSPGYNPNTDAMAGPATTTGLPTRTIGDYAADVQDIRKAAAQRSGSTPTPAVEGGTPINVGPPPQGFAGVGGVLPQYPTLQSIAQARLAAMRGLR